MSKESIREGRRSPLSAMREKGALRAKKKMDIPFLIILLALLGIGLACMFSASYAYSYYYRDGDSYFFIRRQAIFAVVGVAVMLICSLIDYHMWRKLALPVLGVAFVLLIIVLVIPSEDGIHRWITAIPGLVQIQPSEVAKFAIILFFANLIALNYNRMKTFKVGYLPFMIVLAAVAFLIVEEPHLSGTILVVTIGLIMMYIGGTRPLYILLTLAVGALGIGVLVFGLGYEKDRIDVWLKLFETFANDRDQAWQTMQSLYAIGSGGLLGQGFGNSRQKHLFLPEPQNDFVFSVVCEELGFIGATIIILLFALLVWRGFVIAMKAPDKFGYMFAIGLTVQVAVQVALNIAVVTNLLPNTGISLPFFSYGGSSLIMLLAEMGIVLSISRQARDEKREKPKPETEAVEGKT